MKVVLDPGHGKGDNKGAVNGYAEGTAMYEYALRLMAKLKASGITVGITRSNVSDNPTLTARGKQAAGADLFVSLHSNAADSPSATGVTTFYSIKRDKDKSMAADWCKRVAALINGGTRDRGATTRKSEKGNWDYYTVIQAAAATNCPHVFLVEHGFHSNPAECTWLMQDANLEAMANLECQIICEQLGIKPGSTTAAPAEPEKTKPLATKQVNTPGDTLNVRNAANANGTKLGELAHGSKVEVYGVADNGWMLIQQGSLRGWVNGKYLEDAKADFDPFAPYLVRVTADALNIRKGPGTSYAITGCIRDKGGIYTIVEEQGTWGMLKSGAGWISLNYTEKR